MLPLVKVSIKFLLFKETSSRKSCALAVNISYLKKKNPGTLWIFFLLSFNFLHKSKLYLADCCVCMCMCTLQTKSSYHSQVLLGDVTLSLSCLYLPLLLTDFFFDDSSLFIPRFVTFWGNVERNQNIYFPSGFLFIQVYILLRKKQIIKVKVGMTRQL